MERAEGGLKPLTVESLLMAYGITDPGEIDAFRRRRSGLHRRGHRPRSQVAAGRCRACLVNFANRVKEAGRRSHNAQDMTVWGEAVTDGLPDPDRVATQQDFGRELAALRRNAGLTVRQVARAAGLPASTTGDYFSGRHLPPDGRAGQLVEILRACGETDPAVLVRWTSALQRAKRPTGRRATGADAPYRGLARFEREDARWFFGREDVTDLLAALADEENPLPLALVGPSGAGKSSLLRAGLLPRLNGPVGLVEPADTPLATLRAKLGELEASGDAGLLAVIVDQFEAVFTQCQDESERADGRLRHRRRHHPAGPAVTGRRQVPGRRRSARWWPWCDAAGGCGSTAAAARPRRAARGRG